jgi:citrate synthase
VKPQTIYAYVSRGLLTRQRRPGSRASWLDAAEVARLAGRGRSQGASSPHEVRIESAVTTIAGGRWYYRGNDPTTLARTLSFEQTAELLWTGEAPAVTAWVPEAKVLGVARAAQRVLPRRAPPFDRLPLVTAALAGTDAFRHDLSRAAVLSGARRLLPTLIESLPAARTERSAPRDSIALRIWRRVSATKPSSAQISALDDALVLLADHELAASTFAVRIAAALRADLYGAMGAGFGVLGGALHGAISLAAEDMLREIETAGSVATVVNRRLRRGERLPGFGHALYPNGDPRTPALLELARAVGRNPARVRRIESLLADARSRGLPPPNSDLGIAALAHVLDLCHGAGELIFALARMAGWIAHALEEYDSPSAIRPRALYTGPSPTS